jgi:hypothetical protein
MLSKKSRARIAATFLCLALGTSAVKPDAIL